MYEGDMWKDEHKDILDRLASMDLADREKVKEFIALENPKLLLKIKDTRLAGVKLLTTLAKRIGGGTEPVIYFHDDADGVSAALVMYKILHRLGAEIPHKNFRAITHQQMASIEKSGFRIFVDIQPSEMQPGDIIVDHHRLIDTNFNYRAMEEDEGNTFVYWPEDDIEDFVVPTSSSILASYLWYLLDVAGFDPSEKLDGIGALNDIGVGLIKADDLLDFIHSTIWPTNIFMKNIALLGAVSDNLWQISFSGRTLVKKWVDISDLDEEDVIKYSIVLSLLLGEDDRKDILVDGMLTYADHIIKGVSPDETWVAFKEDIGKLTVMARYLLEFCEKIVATARKAQQEVYARLSADISDIESGIEKARKDLETYRASMPIKMKTSGEMARGMLDSVADLKNPQWKRIDFFSKEIKRLERTISIEENRLKLLKARLERASPGNIRGMVVFLPRQYSEQVKGIVASLLYYHGMTNIVMEEGEGVTIWGSRGLTRSELEEALTTLFVDKKKLDYYISVEEGSHGLPSTVKGMLGNVSKDFYKAEYVGGGGGRGLIFGGTIKGRVPQFFALFDPNDLLETLGELVKHGELSNAIRSLTERGSQVSLTQALKVKFRDSPWIMVQVNRNGRSGDILNGDLGHLEIWLAGIRKDYRAP